MITAEAGVAGFYTLTVGKLDADGNMIPRQVVGPFKNIILDQGLERMGTDSSWFSYCQVGSGNTPPSVTDTALQSHIAGSNTAVSNTLAVGVSEDYYARRRRVYQFAEGVAAGNISEVGVGWAASGSTLYSRALVVDGSNNPITITVLSDEVLEVTYEHRIYPPLTDVTGTVNISGVDYDYTLRAANVTSDATGFGPGWGLSSSSSNGNAAGLRPSNNGHSCRSGDLAPVTGIPSGTIPVGSLSVSNAAYSAGTLRRDGTLTWGLGGDSIRSIVYCFYWGAFQIQFTPLIPKSASNVLSLTFRIAWARRTI